MPYVFDTITSKDNLSVASQAANTNRMIGIVLAKVKCEFRIIRVAMKNSDNIMPSRHNSEDIKWDRYISSPTRDTVKAIIIIIYTKGTW